MKINSSSYPVQMLVMLVDQHQALQLDADRLSGKLHPFGQQQWLHCIMDLDQ
jgi:hypothetical protein